ncbi:hypothetical protein F4861DRAFT_509771 [Xylaria intraflava]|nr:hypothetical protein F4861DRAFT_509771 [Xylaria intraflava]
MVVLGATPTRRDSWWRPELKEYGEVGNAYDGDYDGFSRNWAVPDSDQSRPYLTWVNKLSRSGWVHLQVLADFMSIGTVPQRWEELTLDGPLLSGSEVEDRKEKRRKRIEKTNVCVLDYYPTEVKKKTFISSSLLKESLDNGVADSNLKFRLYVVEDLSRDVIEILGHKFKVEPDFFRVQVADFAWYNVRDRWRNPPLLDITSKSQNWMQLRYVTARYFDSSKGYQTSFKQACDEAAEFNVLRRVDNDLSNKSVWDNPKAIMGLTRSRAALWLQPEANRQGPPIGILLLDPTVKEGVPLWRGRRTLWPMPSYEAVNTESPPQQGNFFEDFVFWAQQTNLYPNFNTEDTPKALIPMQVLLHLVGSEWLTMSDYIKTRITQLDWEIMKPEFFGLGKEGVTKMLQKLHMWRRLVPLYREMVGEAIRHVDQFSPRIQRCTAASGTSPTTEMPHMENETQPSSIESYRQDYSLVLSQLEEYQRRVDQLTSVVTAIISIENSQRSLQDNQNIGRLTWLATIFIPLSLIAGVLSIQPDIRQIDRYTFTVYFATSLPLAFVIAIVGSAVSRNRSPDQKAQVGFIHSVWNSWAHSKNS